MGDFELSAVIRPELDNGSLQSLKERLQTSVGIGGGGGGPGPDIGGVMQGMAGTLGRILKTLGVATLVLTALHEAARPVFIILKTLFRPMALAIFSLTRSLADAGGLREALRGSQREMRDNPLKFGVKALVGGLVGGKVGGMPGGIIGTALGPILPDVIGNLSESLGGVLRGIADNIEGGGLGTKILKGTITGLADILEGSGKAIKDVLGTTGSKGTLGEAGDAVSTQLTGEDSLAANAGEASNKFVTISSELKGAISDIQTARQQLNEQEERGFNIEAPAFNSEFGDEPGTLPPRAGGTNPNLGNNKQIEVTSGNGPGG